MSTSTSTSKSIKSISTEIEEIDNVSPIQPHSTTISRIKQHLRQTKKKWGPLMAAKEFWDDEYNFPPGRYAGQDDRKLI
ncbi:hypothetical protein N7520_001205 [Penicillium odoratum]|uniref:uncharacterized protein n=1 Tax=Penicillium odoratum TaxID=1167516 RepID=UPI0025490DA8|nr:uncharacterized protein N7520_001205 [Penicillium odoratum]KAJ5777959.1 hypothetical protein N7520_001205 [Penicillium odoratum]